LNLFERLLKLVHPFMPFITEELWHQLGAEGDCILSAYPLSQVKDPQIIENVETLKNIISNVRDVRNKNGLKQRELLPLKAIKSANVEAILSVKGATTLLEQLAFVSEVEAVSEDIGNAVGFLIGTDKYFVVLSKEIDVESDLSEKKKELEYQIGFVNSVSKKLDNANFVAGAPVTVVEKERQKLSDGNERIKILTEEIAKLEALLAN
ncbi:MAG TPA: class I tRNA ligase family protein, partial [Saprospiraceae bacterium]|nr:class I tRNA ligase family protein [Saprospiraceae bacterium]